MSNIALLTYTKRYNSLMFTQYRTDIETALRGISGESVQKVVSLLGSCRKQNAATYILGNGGSAATASHFANDLVKMCGIRAYSLPDMVSGVLAYGNDHGWENMFADLLGRILQPYDVVVGISCSGRSRNVVEALKLARDYNLPGLRTAGLIGANLACPLALVPPDALVSVPYKDIKVQEDCHLIICHSIAGALSDGREDSHRLL